MEMFHVPAPFPAGEFYLFPRESESAGALWAD